VRFSQAWIVARHDIGIFRRRRGIILGLIAFPLAVGIGFPLLIEYIVSQGGPSTGLESSLPYLVNAFSWWFVVGAAALPTAIAAYGIVGEKIEKSLEPLLATPTTDGEILLGKVLAAFIPTMIAVWAGSILFQVLVDVWTHNQIGYLLYPSWEMAIIMFVLAPLSCLYAVEFCVIASSRATDARTAQQYGGFVFFPMIVIYVAGEIGFFPLDTTNLLYIGGGMVLVALGLFFVSTKMFRREEILTQWK
jgi:ABC-2 type transport system permease protein